MSNNITFMLRVSSVTSKMLIWKIISEEFSHMPFYYNFIIHRGHYGPKILNTPLIFLFLFFFSFVSLNETHIEIENIDVFSTPRKISNSIKFVTNVYCNFFFQLNSEWWLESLDN